LLAEEMIIVGFLKEFDSMMPYYIPLNTKSKHISGVFEKDLPLCWGRWRASVDVLKHAHFVW